MKKLILTLILGASGALFAAAPAPGTRHNAPGTMHQAQGTPPAAQPTPEQAARRKASARRLNERVEVPNSRHGTFLFANAASKDVPREMIDAMMKRIAKHIDLAYEVVNVDAATPADASKTLRAKACAAGVFIVYDKTLPILLAAPEDNWAMLNVRALMMLDADEAKLKRRIEGELYRAFMAASGAMRSQYGGNLMGIVGAKNIDDIPEFFLPFDVMQRMEEQYAHIGLAPRKYVRYMTAVQQGWAPAPTNDVQREIVEIYRKHQAKRAAEDAARQKK